MHIYYDDGDNELTGLHFKSIVHEQQHLRTRAKSQISHLSFQIKIIAAELIIRYEIGDFDILEMRIKSVKTRFKDILTKPRYNREKLLIKIISKLIYIQRADLNKSLRNDINLILSIATSEEAEETDIINYNKWLSENFSRN